MESGAEELCGQRGAQPALAPQTFLPVCEEGWGQKQGSEEARSKDAAGCSDKPWGCRTSMPHSPRHWE